MSGQVVTDITAISNKKRILVSIKSTRTVDRLTSRVTLYTIQSIVTGSKQERGEVERRYKDFDRLYNALYYKYGKHTIPEFLVGRNKLWEDHFTPEFIEDRRLLLTDWLNRTLNINSDIQNDPVVIEFLQIRDSFGAYSETTATIGKESDKITSTFSMTSDAKVIPKDTDIIPDNIMPVYHISNDDL